MAQFSAAVSLNGLESGTPENRTVLVVDDDPAFRYLCVSALQEAADVEYEVLEAGTGQQALDLLMSRNVDKVLVDYDLPDTTGAKLMHDVQQMMPGWLGSMVLITAVGSEEIAAEALRAGAADYIPKGLSPSEFRSSLYDSMEKAKLHNAIRRQNEDLANANQELQRRNDEIARFYHRVSHEVKTPLTAARMFMSMLHEGLVGKLTAEQEDVVVQAIESCDQLTEQFNDLIECTRLETGKLPLRKTVQSLTRVLQRSVIALKPTIEARSIRLEQCVASDMPDFLMDGGRIAQVMANILGNATKFTAPGGRIVLSANVSSALGNWIEVSISDSGCGIPPKHLPNIFDRLYQVGSGGDSLQGAGLGLGLTIAKEIVELHRGTIEVNSEVGKGSTFTIRLPMIDNNQSEVSED